MPSIKESTTKRRLLATMMAATILLSPTSNRNNHFARANCVTEDDLDFETCHLKDLPNSALESICSRIGLDLEMHVFPYLFDEEEGEVEEREETPIGTKRHPPKERTHEDYVQAAKECLSIEEETERMMTEDPEAMAELERAMLAEDPALLAEIVADVLAKSPDLVAELEAELEKEDPELFTELMNELSEGQTLADRPEILAELVAMMLAEDPDMLDKLDEEVAAHITDGMERDEGEGTGAGAGAGEL